MTKWIKQSDAGTAPATREPARDPQVGDYVVRWWYGDKWTCVGQIIEKTATGYRLDGRMHDWLTSYPAESLYVATAEDHEFTAHDARDTQRRTAESIAKGERMMADLAAGEQQADDDL